MILKWLKNLVVGISNSESARIHDRMKARAARRDREFRIALDKEFKCRKWNVHNAAWISPRFLHNHGILHTLDKIHICYCNDCVTIMYNDEAPFYEPSRAEVV